VDDVDSPPKSNNSSGSGTLKGSRESDKDFIAPDSAIGYDLSTNSGKDCESKTDASGLSSLATRIGSFIIIIITIMILYIVGKRPLKKIS
jgi:hypothetical protein